MYYFSLMTNFRFRNIALVSNEAFGWNRAFRKNSHWQPAINQYCLSMLATYPTYVVYADSVTFWKDAIEQLVMNQYCLLFRIK